MTEAISHTLSVRQSLAGKHLLLIGATGFLGKVLLATLMHRVPEIGSVTLLIRRGRDGMSAHDRWQSQGLTSPVFAPWRAAYSPDDFAHLIETKIRVVAGDVTLPGLGLSPEATHRIAAHCDLVVNVAGNVEFNPPLADGLAVNVHGTAHVLELARKLRTPRLLHTSTCFVAGNRSGTFAEDAPLVDWNPRGTPFAFRDEITRCATELAHASAESANAWGLQRAKQLGWPNIYTYTKALGEQTVAAATDVRSTIVRPAIIETAQHYPEVGWNEGINTSAPIVYLGLMGQICYPSGEGVILDVIPVDMTCNAMCAIIAAQCVDQAEPLYQLGSSDTNPLPMEEAVELTGLYKRKYLRVLATHSPLARLLSWTETIPVTWEHFERSSAPRLRRLARSAGKGVERATRMLPKAVQPLTMPLATAIKSLHTLGKWAEELFRLYRPFIYDNVYVFETKAVRRLYAILSKEDHDLFPWTPETIDWRQYWIHVHLDGLAKHSFPHLDAKTKRRPQKPEPTKVTALRTPPDRQATRNIYLPRASKAIIRAGLGKAEHYVYDRVFATDVQGRANIPYNRNVLVVANHASHLDAGLVKYALGKYGQRLRALAASDYFFRNMVRQLYFTNFTNLLPINRSADLHQSLSPAVEALRNGEVVLMFPEGTRSLNGQMGRFKRGVGHLALTTPIDVLPVFLYGTYEAIPKGNYFLPSQRNIGAIIGELISFESLQAATQGMPADQSYRKASSMIEHKLRAIATAHDNHDLPFAAFRQSTQKRVI